METLMEMELLEKIGLMDMTMMETRLMMMGMDFAMGKRCNGLLKMEC